MVYLFKSCRTLQFMQPLVYDRRSRGIRQIDCLPIYLINLDFFNNQTKCCSKILGVYIGKKILKIPQSTINCSDCISGTQDSHGFKALRRCKYRYVRFACKLLFYLHPIKRIDRIVNLRRSWANLNSHPASEVHLETELRQFCNITITFQAVQRSYRIGNSG